MEQMIKGLKQWFTDPEQVTFYASYGYRDGDEWVMPLRVWVHEPRCSAQDAFSRIATGIGNLADAEAKLLRERIAAMLADSESRERVSLRFDDDPEEEVWPLCGTDGKRLKTDLNGTIECSLRVPVARAAQLLTAQRSKHGWLHFHAASRDHHGIGSVRLIEPTGSSLVSDIDDTVKVTDIPAGARVVLRNTFLREFVAARGMRERYRALGDATAFHYVSGGPWQLYGPISTFLRAADFPPGSMHMKNVPAHLLSPNTWQDLYKLLGDATVEQKLAQIGTILTHFPDRRFTLVGDSGEHDPEIYAELRARHQPQIAAVWIRDVVNAHQVQPERLTQMEVIEAPSIERAG